MVVVEYIDEAFAGRRTETAASETAATTAETAGTAAAAADWPALLPADPGERARARYWCGVVGDRITPHYYKLLMAPEGSAARAAAHAGLLSGLKVQSPATAPATPLPS